MVKAGDDGGGPPIDGKREQERAHFLSKQEGALMSITEKMIDQCRNSPAFGPVNERVYVLFERAKEIHRAQSDRELDAAIASATNT
jgi:hypothetical protein